MDAFVSRDEKLLLLFSSDSPTPRGLKHTGDIYILTLTLFIIVYLGQCGNEWKVFLGPVEM